MNRQHLHTTSVRAACSACNARPFDLCVDSDGNPLERCHPVRVAAARTVPQYTQQQLDALDAILDRPNKVLHPSVGASLRRDGLIIKIDQPVPPNPNGRHKHYRAPRHTLTARGHEIRVATGRCCPDLVPFVDGELTEDRAAAFRAHLPGCERCQAETTEAVQVSARLSEMAR